jgi:hypothetical protein
MHKKRLVFCCGSSLLALGLGGLPDGLDQAHRGLVTKRAQADPSCFTAGTSILMADGSARPIEALRPGDRVVGRRGRVNRVLALQRTRLGARRLHAFNGGRPFVTAEHPFLTTEGWKALDLEGLRGEGEALGVAPLRLGDCLCRGAALPVAGERRWMPSAPGVLFMQSSRPLEAIKAVADDADLPLFNLRLDGDHSYVADGWIVHNKDGAAAADDRAVVDAAAAPSLPRPPSKSPTSLEELLRSLGIDLPAAAGLRPVGPPLSPEEERALIERGWRAE